MQYALELFLRIVVSFSILWLGIRFLGKKQFGELTVYNVATASAVGEMASDFATQFEQLPLTLILAMLGYFILAYGMGWLSMKSRRMQKALEGSPTLVIVHGKILDQNLRRLGITVELLLEKLREKNAFRVQEIEYAIMEADGKMSVMFMPSYEPLTASALNVRTPYKGLLIDIVADGQIIMENLRKLRLSKDWLLAELEKKHILHVTDVFLAQIDETGNVYIDLKADWENSNTP